MTSRLLLGRSRSLIRPFTWRSLSSSSAGSGGDGRNGDDRGARPTPPSSAPPTKRSMMSPLKRPATLPRLESAEVVTKPEQLRKRAFFRFFDFVGDYKSVLDKILPAKAVEIYTLFLKGSKGLFTDMKEFASVYQTLSSTSDWKKACQTLSRKQLELYMSLPQDLYKVAPVLMISALPLMQNVVFPLALLYPKLLLSSHFWTPQVAKEVELDAITKRQSYYRLLLRDMLKRLESFRGQEYYQSCKAVLSALVAGDKHPSPEEILELRPIFCDGANFGLHRLPAMHVRHLMKANGLEKWWRWRYHLHQHANLLNQIDLAIVREGVASLDNAALCKCCLARGLNVHQQDQGLHEDEMVEYLSAWLRVSRELDTHSVSLLLHLPIFLGYHHRSRLWDSSTVD